MGSLKKQCQRKSKEYEWVEPKFRYLKGTTLDEKRQIYNCGWDFKTIEEVKRWDHGCHFAPQGEELVKLRELHKLPELENLKGSQEPNGSQEQEQKKSTFSYDYFKVDPCLNKKIGILIGTIDTIEVDAVVNPCNQYFYSCMELGQLIPPPSSNVFNYIMIHKAAGPYLRKECNHIKVCPIGEARITGGYKLPAKYVIHTAAPTMELPDDIETCYINSLRLALENGIKTIAFPCISTGDKYGFPTRKTTERVLRAVRLFLELNHTHIELIVFCLMDEEDKITYQDFLPRFFPL